MRRSRTRSVGDPRKRDSLPAQDCSWEHSSDTCAFQSLNGPRSTALLRSCTPCLAPSYPVDGIDPRQDRERATAGNSTAHGVLLRPTRQVTSAAERLPGYGNRKFRCAEVPQPNGPSGRAAEPTSGSGHASLFLIVTASTTRDSEPLMPPTARARPTEPQRAYRKCHEAVLADATRCQYLMPLDASGSKTVSPRQMAEPRDPAMSEK